MNTVVANIQFMIEKSEHVAISMHCGVKGQETDPREDMYLRLELAGSDGNVAVTFNGPGGALVALFEKCAHDVLALLAEAVRKAPCADAKCKHGRNQHGAAIPFACSACACPAFDEGRAGLSEPFRSMTEDEARNWHIRRDERNGRHTP